MNHAKQLSVRLRPYEQIAGWIYLPFYLFLLSLILTLVLLALGVEILDPMVQIKLNLAFGILNFIAIGLIFHRFLIQNFQVMCHHLKNWILAVLLGFVIYWLGTIAISTIITIIHPDISNLNNDTVNAMAEMDFQAMLIYTVALAPIVEEALFRGLLFAGVHHRSRIGAYILSVTAFSAIHVVGFIGIGDWLTLVLSFFQYIPAGIALCWAYEKADSIWAPITIHIIINAIAMLASAFL